MAQSNSRDTGNEIDVFVTMMVIEVLKMSLDYEEWFFVEMEIKVGHKGGPIFHNLFISWSRVECWLMIDSWEWSLEMNVVRKCVPEGRET